MSVTDTSDALELDHSPVRFPIMIFPILVIQKPKSSNVEISDIESDMDVTEIDYSSVIDSSVIMTRQKSMNLRRHFLFLLNAFSSVRAVKMDRDFLVNKTSCMTIMGLRCFCGSTS